MPTALVVGGSIAGLFAANLLVRAGWTVSVAERSAAPLAGRGAGIVTHPALLRVLERAGMPPGTELGVAVPGRRALRRDGTIAAERALPQVLTSWSRLHALLEAALPEGIVRRGAAVTALTADDDGVTVRFEGGDQARAALVVAADGIRSTCRGQLAPEAEPVYAGYIAWRGLVEEAALGPATRDAICGHFAFSLPEGEQMLGYPVAGMDGAVAPGRRRFNFVWYRPADAATLQDLQTGSDGTPYPNGIPPGRIRPALVTAMRAEAARVLAPPFAEVVACTPNPFFQPITDLEMPRMAWGRVAIIGDAAFVARPHLGMGVTKAAEDAEALTVALARHASIPDALASWGAERTLAGRAVVHRARQLGAYMQASRTTSAEREAAERHRSIEAVLRETAVA